MHIKENINKANSGIGLTRKLQSKLPRNALLTIHKSFVRLRLDYGDIVYDQPIVYDHPTNDSFDKKLESVLYNAALVATGPLKEPSENNSIKTLIDRKSLKLMRKLRHLCVFYKIK